MSQSHPVLRQSGVSVRVLYSDHSKSCVGGWVGRIFLYSDDRFVYQSLELSQIGDIKQSQYFRGAIDQYVTSRWEAQFHLIQLSVWIGRFRRCSRRRVRLWYCAGRCSSTTAFAIDLHRTSTAATTTTTATTTATTSAGRCISISDKFRESFADHFQSDGRIG